MGRLAEDWAGKEGGYSELSVMTGIPKPHISQMERGKRPIGKKIAHQLGQALQVDYRVFL